MRKQFLLLISVLLFNITQAQNVGIGTSTPQAALDVSSSNQGFLPPRLTIAQRDGISNPVAGLVIFCIDCDELQLYNGIIWKNMAGSAACSQPIPPIVSIGNQVWMVKNLDVITYRNGDTIPQVSDPFQWSNTSTGAWCWVNNDSVNNSVTYGKLYNWNAVNDPRGLAPIGWHIPTDLEWTILSTYLGGETDAGGKMKEAGIAHWGTPFNPNVGATNSSGFTGYGSGYRKTDGICSKFTVIGYWWSASELSPGSVWYRNMNYNNINIDAGVANRKSGFSVRCLKD